jgi:hypothetical protein
MTLNRYKLTYKILDNNFTFYKETKSIHAANDMKDSLKVMKIIKISVS